MTCKATKKRAHLHVVFEGDEPKHQLSLLLLHAAFRFQVGVIQFVELTRLYVKCICIVKSLANLIH